MNELEDIRSRITIEEVMSPYVQMKQVGRNYKALCPFHQEKTPSFIISPDKGLAYCFGCRKGGDIFACIQELENVDFPGAVKILAEKAGIELKQSSLSPKKKEKKDRILKLVQDSQQFFQKQLKKNHKAIAYLEQRHYDEKIYQEFKLGFAPDSFHELIHHLKKKGYNNKDILDAGLASQKEVGDSNIYDRFRNRIIFPIHNSQGKLVAFGGRTLSKDANAAKYLNSPETDYYHKGNNLYCFHMAKQAIREQDQAIVVEGYFDALSAHIKGFHQTVASLGTALTEQQIKLMGRFTKNLLFAFDADISGQTAASRSIEIAQKLGYSVKIIRIPSGKDPDEALHSDPAEWEKAVAEAINATDYELQKALATADKTNIEGKKSILQHMLPIIGRLPNAVEQEFYLKKLAMELETSLKSLIKELNRHQPRKQVMPDEEKTKAPEPKKDYSRSEYLLGLLMNFPEHRELTLKALKADFLPTEEEKKLYKFLIDHYNQAETNSKEKPPLESEEMPGKARLQLLELYAEQQCEAFTSEEEIKQEVERLCQHIRQDYKKQRLQELRFQLAKNDAPDPLMKEYHLLLANDF